MLMCAIGVGCTFLNIFFINKLFALYLFYLYTCVCVYVLKTIVNKFIILALYSNVIPVKSECEKHKK